MIAHRGLRHLAIRVADVERAKEFYARAFGMKVAWQPDADNVYMTSGCDSLAFHRGEAGDPAAQSLDHFGFVVATVAEAEAAYKWTQDNRIEIAHPIRRHRDGSVSFYIRDPDRNVIQVLYEPSISPLNLVRDKGRADASRGEIMLKNSATAAGTSAYAKRFPTLPGNFRSMLGLAVGSIGIGTYLGEPDTATDAAYEEALKAALRGGINLIDTAVNYRFQRSERVIGKVLAELVASGEVMREEVVVATKGGYITFDGGVPSDPRAWFEENYVRTGIVGPGDMVEGSHCMTPRYLDAMLEKSRANLGLETIDIYYVHNPESQLGAVSRDEFKARIRRAFEFLEATASDGKIRFYGAATWNGFRVAPTDRSYHSLIEMVKIAEEVGGKEHRFRAIQLPYNLAMAEAFTFTNQDLPDGAKGNTLAVADATGIAVCASASLLQGRLTQGLPAILAEAFDGFESDAQRSLQFVRSTPGVKVALAGMSHAEHVGHNLETAKRPPASFESLMKLFQRAK